MDAEFEIDGITVVSVLPPRSKHRSEPERIELLAPARELPGVTTQLSGRGDRRGPGRGEHRGPRSDAGPRTRASGERPGGPRERHDARRSAPESGTHERGGSAASRAGRGSGPTDRNDNDAAGQDNRPGGDLRDRPNRSRPAGEGRPTAPSRGSRRLNPGDAHRRAVLESLPPEQRPIAEQLLRGGIPAVRSAIHLERDKASAEGRPAPRADSLIALAETIHPRIKAAEWLDRAEAAQKAGDEISLRDLRSVVTGADLARDDDSRALAANLRENLESRLARLHTDWTAEIRKHLDEHRVVRALRLAGRPPEPTTRLDADLAARLVESASAALGPETSAERWVAVLEAVAASPVSRNVKPTGLPSDPPETLLTTARQQVGRVPALAGLLGIRMPPPPGPVRGPGSTVPPPPGRRSRPGRSGPPRSATPTPPPGSTAAPVGTTPADLPPVVTTPDTTPTGAGEPGSAPEARGVTTGPAEAETDGPGAETAEAAPETAEPEASPAGVEATGVDARHAGSEPEAAGTEPAEPETADAEPAAAADAVQLTAEAEPAEPGPEPAEPGAAEVEASPAGAEPAQPEAAQAEPAGPGAAEAVQVTAET